ncbi:hypothetical protein RINTHM_4150 [Richelia intracellularis HM01]|nr:hypothetical protein RINTHM_4150 [Richelia intracellularis HM01]
MSLELLFQIVSSTSISSIFTHGKSKQTPMTINWELSGNRLD